MNPTQIENIRDSFVHVLFAPERAAKLFYNRLFEIAPETRAMFHNDIAAQGRRLISAIATIVTGLERLDKMQPAICDLAVRHVAYGVRDHHYDSVGAALLHMVAALAGPGFDAETEAAWSEAYAQIAGTMIAASRKAA